MAQSNRFNFILSLDQQKINIDLDIPNNHKPTQKECKAVREIKIQLIKSMNQFLYNQINRNLMFNVGCCITNILRDYNKQTGMKFGLINKLSVN